VAWLVPAGWKVNASPVMLTSPTVPVLTCGVTVGVVRDLPVQKPPDAKRIAAAPYPAHLVVVVVMIGACLTGWLASTG